MLKPQPLRVAPLLLLAACVGRGDGDTADTAVDTGVSVGPITCLSVAPIGGQVAVLEMDMSTGTWSEVGRYGSTSSSLHVGGLARTGDLLTMAAYGGNDFEWWQLDLNAGTLTQGSDTSQVSVASDGVDLFTYTSGGAIGRYADFAALDADSPSAVSAEDHISGTRLGVDGALAYVAWHTTAEVTVHDVVTGLQLRTIPLDRWDTWVWGVSVADGDLFLIDDARGPYSGSDERIGRYDQNTGALLDEVFFTNVPEGGRVSGLWCE
ncbi:MAG: hypothetical protein H6739_29110 [Alphaproteobacteria bacterium]|nr:hypothetical protein [Alphaproteobacteria bacterium]